VKNDYGNEEGARTLNGLEEPLKKKSLNKEVNFSF
jgi:hypothetical protein